MTDPLELLAQRVAEYVVDYVLHVLDVNALVQRIDLNLLLDHVDVGDHVLRKIDVNALLDRVDVNAVLRQVDVNALLARVDVNELLQRVDLDALVEQTDVGAIIATSSGSAANDALDAARSQTVGMDQFIDRWVQRALPRKHEAPVAPRALLNGHADS